MTDPRQPDYAALLKRSLVAIDQLEAKLAAAERARTEPIAIIGMGCRFPQTADTPAAFWDLLRNGVDAVTEVPKERWDVDRYYDPNPDAPGKSYTRWGAFIRNVDQFDAAFFGVSPREAVSLDPQQRLLLEVTWESLEHAGISPASLAGSQTAVYVGITTHDYAMELAEAMGSRNGDAYTPSGTAHSVAAGRLSYVLGLHGPNVAIDTACSSSLVAMHWAVHSLRQRESDLALAGGVNLTLTPDGSILTSRARMMSFDGHCKTFDASADGYVRGEGCGMLVLKRLSDAQRDGDHVLAVVRGSALNQDGRSSGLTAPNGTAQEAVIRAALTNARLQPGDVDYVEAHGTGTPLGDPIEIKALNQVYGGRDPQRPLRVGSVKTNIGHLEAAAGIAGVMKTVLALQHRAIPPHLHLHKPNPLIAWDQCAISVPTRLTPWETVDGAPRRAAVSSFGFSGTNAHVLLEEAPPPAAAAVAPAASHQLLVLSAQTPAALRDQALRLRQALSQPDAPALADVAATLALGRSHLIERAAFVARSAEDAMASLASFAAGEAPAGVLQGRASSGTPPEIVFLFTGQGAQYPGMARRLFDTQPVFRAAMQECDRLVSPRLPRPLLEVIFAMGDDAALLDDTAFTQPALFAVEYALAQLWRAWGVEPTAVMGHSVGEYVAACVAGVFSLEDGLKLIAERGRLMSALPRDGAMAAVFADEARVRQALQGQERQLSVAATNGPQNTVIAGRSEAVDAVLAAFTAQGVESQRLKVSHAFHSALMEPMLDAFEAVAATVRFAPPQIGLISNVSGQLAGSDVCSAGYWRRHVREAVRFSESIAALQRDGYRVFVEVGPAPTLLGMAQRCDPATGSVWVGSLRKGRDDTESMLENLGLLHVNGVRAQWLGVLGEGARGRRAVLPTYPFQREHYWHDLGTGKARTTLGATRSGHPLLGGVVASPLRIFESEIGVQAQPWLQDHRIFDFTLFPATGFLELATAAAREAIGSDDCQLRDLVIREGLVLPDDGAARVQVIVTPGADGAQQVQVYSSEALRDTEPAAPAWRLHVSCTAAAVDATAPPPLSLPALREQAGTEMPVMPYYDKLEAQGAHYGPAFRGIREIRRGTQQVLGRVELPAELAGSAAALHVHPALLDACVQLIGAGLDWSATPGGSQDDICVPVGLASYRVFRSGTGRVACHVTLESAANDADTYRADLTLADDAGRVIAEIRGLELRRITRAALQRAVGHRAHSDWLFETAWVPLPPSAAAAEPQAGRWLVLADAGGLGAGLAQRLQAQGDAVVQVRAGDAFDISSEAWSVDAREPAQLARVLSESAQRDPRPLRGVVALWALDAAPASTCIETTRSAQDQLLASSLALAQALPDCTARLWFVTRGAQPVAGSVPDLVQAPAWGLAGVMASEYPALRCVRLDLGPEARDDDAQALFESLRSTDAEDRVAWRGGQRYVARLVPGSAEPAAPEAALRLEITERGTLENLKLQRVEREAPGPGQVEIRVHATGLNFRDVLNALGMYPGDPGPLGNECAGVVSAVGAGLADFRVGDEVVSMVDRSFATWVVAPASLTVHKPVSMSFAEAATVPVTFLTAQYALRDLSHIKKGDRVLIHAVTGGVGMAALQLALRAGAEVFGTAGTPAKRALARSLGAHHVGDSRSLTFAADVVNAIGCVDIVLNSLAGDFIPESLRLLRPGGHFVEIGKTGIWDGERVAREFPGVHYHPLYLGEVAAARPQFVRGMLQELMAAIGAGELSALPLRSYPIDRAEAAFRFMGQGHHTGKIVITQDRMPAVRADASYLITGGLGGLGLACARWLAGLGARHLWLLGRSAASPLAQQAIAELQAAGVQVATLQADVADAAALHAALDAASAQHPPLRGIVHAAGTVDDGMLPEQSMQRFAKVMAPKVQGTWNLHHLPSSASLDFFVMFSSGAALLGSPGQGNYAAANSFMDALAHVRRARGEHALSINWGSWSDVGMAAEVGEMHRRRWASMGLSMIAPDEGVRMLQEVLFANRTPQAALMPLVRSRLPANLGPFFAQLQQARPASAAPASGTAAAVDILPRLAAASAEERPALLSAFLADQVVKVLALGASHRVDLHRSLMDLGMDSLMAMELRNRIQTSVKARVAVADLLKGPSIHTLTADLLAGMGDTDAALPGAVAAPQQPATMAVPAQQWEEGSL